MNNLEKYFENIVARSYIGLSNKDKRNRTILNTEVQNVYFTMHFSEDVLLFGKTLDIYFLLIFKNDNNFAYSTILMHEEPTKLLENVNKKYNLYSGNVEDFWNSVLLKYKLENDLTKKETKKIFKI